MELQLVVYQLESQQYWHQLDADDVDEDVVLYFCYMFLMQKSVFCMQLFYFLNSFSYFSSNMCPLLFADSDKVNCHHCYFYHIHLDHLVRLVLLVHHLFFFLVPAEGDRRSSEGRVDLGIIQ